jgi:ketosteroid isomerase-like protein
MSQENLEASKRAWERFLAGDMDGALAHLDPEVEVHDPPELPDSRVYRGHEGYLEQIEKFREAFSDIDYEVLESLEAGDKVVHVVRATGVGTGSGVGGEVTYAQVETWRDGKAVRYQYFLSSEAALEAAGLSEAPASLRTNLGVGRIPQ